MRLLGRLIANAIVGLILLFLTNLFLADEVPVNLITIVICAVGGMAGYSGPPPARGSLLETDLSCAVIHARSREREEAA
jgi:hypothetical protein